MHNSRDANCKQGKMCAWCHISFCMTYFSFLPEKQWLCHASLAGLASTLPTHCSFDNLLFNSHSVPVLCWIVFVVVIVFQKRFHVHDSSGVFHKTLTLKKWFIEEERVRSSNKFEIIWPQSDSWFQTKRTNKNSCQRVLVTVGEIGWIGY